MTSADEGWSGVNFDRPSIKRMLEDIRNGFINCIIVRDLSRFGRNYIETGKLLERVFPFLGTRFIAIIDNYDSQKCSNQDYMMIPFRNLINDFYCADLSRKVRYQLNNKRRKGEFTGSFAAYGYLKSPVNKNKLVIDEIVAPVIQNIFNWKIEGFSNQGIASKLNELRILPPFEYKKSTGLKYTTGFKICDTSKWTPVAVGRILCNELYIGVLTQGLSTTQNYKIKKRIKVYQDDLIRIENTHEPIISKEDFLLTTELVKKDTRVAKGKDTVYLFSGLLQCKDCGKNLVRKTLQYREKNIFIIFVLPVKK